MAYFDLSVFIEVPPEEVYQHVTAFGAAGPLDGAFQAKYGNILSRQGNVFLTQEEEGTDESAGKITWRCTFEYPSRRVMEALDSSWANRVDLFRPVKGGTSWSIRWDTRIGGLKGIVQYVVFRLIGHRRLRRAMVDPVKAQLEGGIREG